MKSINDIILTNAISVYLDESIIKRIENLKDYHINECCGGCNCERCEPCCCGNPQSFIFFNSEDEIVNKLKTDVKVQDIFNLHKQFGNRFRFVEPGKELDITLKPLYFTEYNYMVGHIKDIPVLFSNVKFYTFVQKIVKQFKFAYPTVLSKCDGSIQLFFIMGGGSNGEEYSIKSSLIKAVQVLNGLENFNEINWTQILDVSIDSLDDVYNFVVTCTIDNVSLFDEKHKSIQDFIKYDTTN